MAKKIVFGKYVYEARSKKYQRKAPHCKAGRAACGRVCLRSRAKCHLIERSGRTYYRRRRVGPRRLPKACRGDTLPCGRTCIPYWYRCSIPPHIRAPVTRGLRIYG